jgi:hypothetical protein
MFLQNALFLIIECLYIFCWQLFAATEKFNAGAFKKQNQFLEIWTVINYYDAGSRICGR